MSISSNHQVVFKVKILISRTALLVAVNELGFMAQEGLFPPSCKVILPSLPLRDHIGPMVSLLYAVLELSTATKSYSREVGARCALEPVFMLQDLLGFLLVVMVSELDWRRAKSAQRTQWRSTTRPT